MNGLYELIAPCHCCHSNVWKLSYRDATKVEFRCFYCGGTCFITLVEIVQARVPLMKEKA